MEELEKLYIYRIPQKLLETCKPLTLDAILRSQRSGLSDVPTAENEDSDDESDDGQDSSTTVEPQGAELVRTNIGSPILWFTSSHLPAPKKLGVYKTMLPDPESSLLSIQLKQTDMNASKRPTRTISMFMVGGGHFQGAIISLSDSSTSNCIIKASKGFHRYTTRRKQGGAQSANDNAKGAANSAGAQIRRYNEIALAEDIRGLLKEWSTLLEETELILVRASGQAGKKLLYDNGLNKSDSRLRKIPINTSRATQAEIVRTFHVLTRVHVGSLEEDQLHVKPMLATNHVQSQNSEVRQLEDDPSSVAHSEMICTLIKRNKPSGLADYIDSNSIDIASFMLQPSKIYIHTPTALHYAAANQACLAISQLLDCGADPGIPNEAGKTPFEVADNRQTRDAFRLWRGRSNNESKWNWEIARIPDGLTDEQVRARHARENQLKASADALETERRRIETLRLGQEAADAQQKAEEAEAIRRGPGRTIPGVLGGSTANIAGLTPEMRRKVEREQRARALEARFGPK